jgi:uncharacterized protein YjbI with pentapeptide repeats
VVRIHDRPCLSSKPPAAPDLPQELPPLDGDPALRGLELSERLVEAQDWSAREAESLRLTECRLDNVALDESTLRRARFRDVVVKGGSWANAVASEAELRRVEFRDTRLTGASFANATLVDLVFVDCRLDLSSFRFAKLTRARFEGCRLEEADFYDASVDSTVFSGCSLAGASLAGATFAETELRGCDLTTLGNPERLRGVRMPWADIVQAADVIAAGLGIQVVE